MNTSRPLTRCAGLVAGALLATSGAARAQCDANGIAAGDRRSSDHFAAAMALSNTPAGVRLMVGAPDADYDANHANSGKAYYYSITGNQIFQEAQFHPAFGEYHEGDLFGASVGFSYPYAVVGAWRASNPHVNFGPGGGVYFFKEINGFWDQIDSFYNSQADAGFGMTAAMFGEWAIVGAPLYDVPEGFAPASEDSGMASFYHLVNNHWVADATLVEHDPSGANAGQKLTASVAMWNDVAVIGAPGGHDYAHGVNNGAGFVKILRRNAGNQWVEDGAPRFFASDPAIGDTFGASVATNSFWVVVGAPGCDVAGNTDAGAVYVYAYSQGAWTFRQKIVASDGAAHDRFGSSVSVYNGRLLIGAAGDSAISGQKAYVFINRPGGDWGQEAVFRSPDATAEAFGGTVVSDGVNFVVGDDSADSPNLIDNGEAYHYHVPGAADACDAAITLDIASGQQNVFTGCTQNATPSSPALSCGGPGAGNDVWYSWYPTCSGNVVMDTFGSGFDTILSVHDDCPTPGNDHLVACNDDGFPLPNRASLVTFDYNGGQRYLIRITGYSGAAGAYTLRINDFAQPPSNNSCSNPLTVTAGNTYPFANCAATTDAAPVPAPTCAPIQKDVWFVFNVPTTGTLQLGTCDSDFDTVVSVYAGGACPGAGAVDIACNDDSNAPSPCQPLTSSVSVSVLGGFPYLIRVGAYPWTTAYGGSGTLSVSFVPNPSTCPCDFNGSGHVNSQDFFDFITSFFANAPAADFNGSGAVNSQDFFDFLACFFNPPAGCN